MIHLFNNLYLCDLGRVTNNISDDDKKSELIDEISRLKLRIFMHLRQI